MDLELRALLDSADLVLRGNVRQHIVGVVVHELVRSVLASVLKQDLLATGVVRQPLRDIVDVTLDDNPRGVLCGVLAFRRC